MRIRQIDNLCSALLILVCFACVKNRDEAESSRTINVDEFEFKDGGTLTDWQCFDAEKDRICIPSDWERVSGHTFHFFAHLNNEQSKNEFFVVVRYDTAQVRIDVVNYLKEVVRQVKADTNEVSKEGNFRRLVFEDSAPCYYGEFITEIDGEQYYTYSMYTVRFGYLYDFTVKTEAIEKERLYEDFQNILFNVKVGDHYLFNKKDPIVSIELIDPNSLL